jgi:hypothetical protein
VGCQQGLRDGGGGMVPDGACTVSEFSVQQPPLRRVGRLLRRPASVTVIARYMAGYHQHHFSSGPATTRGIHVLQRKMRYALWCCTLAAADAYCKLLPCRCRMKASRSSRSSTEKCHPSSASLPQTFGVPRILSPVVTHESDVQRMRTGAGESEGPDTTASTR